MKEQLENLDEKVDSLIVSFNELNDKMDKRYAKKWVEMAVGIFVAALAFASLYIIFENAGLTFIK